MDDDELERKAEVCFGAAVDLDRTDVDVEMELPLLDIEVCRP